MPEMLAGVELISYTIVRSALFGQHARVTYILFYPTLISSKTGVYRGIPIFFSNFLSKTLIMGTC